MSANVRLSRPARLADDSGRDLSQTSVRQTRPFGQLMLRDEKVSGPVRWRGDGAHGVTSAPAARLGVL